MAYKSSNILPFSGKDLSTKAGFNTLMNFAKDCNLMHKSVEEVLFELWSVETDIAYEMELEYQDTLWSCRY